MGGTGPAFPPPVSSPTRGEEVSRGVPQSLPILILVFMPLEGEGWIKGGRVTDGVVMARSLKYSSIEEDVQL
jgi:hypothetical protein